MKLAFPELVQALHPESFKPIEPSPSRISLENVTIRFCGDSGDGMQLLGSEFSRASSALGNDLRTLPDYPSEIRAPAGTLAGVSGFQLQIGRRRVYTHGDRPDVLVAMNPAALRANLSQLPRGATLLIDTGSFTDANLTKAGYEKNPVEDGSLAGYRVYAANMTHLTGLALAGGKSSPKDVARSRNMFALGLLLWLFERPTEPTMAFLRSKFRSDPARLAANLSALEAGLAHAENTEFFTEIYRVEQAELAPGLYRNISGNEALALGLLTAAQLSGLPGFLGSYPITPASDILHELARYRHFGFITFQAEDEIAAICSAIGASYGGSLGVTTTSGPGLSLKSEAIGFAVMTELPLVIVDVQRGGPSTGLPTKTEQSDLFQALFGRHGEAPVPVLAAHSPSDCFATAIEAARIAIRHMTPVILLSDGAIGNGQEPWRIPNVEDLQPIPVTFPEPSDLAGNCVRDAETLAPRWVKPGIAHLEHRIGGLEKDVHTGAVSYDAENHDKMVHLRAEKIARVAADYPAVEVVGDMEGVLVLGWGSTYGAIAQAVEHVRARGHKVAHVHLRHLNPLPLGLGAILHRYGKVVIPELNLGQLAHWVSAECHVEPRRISQVCGRPFTVADLEVAIEKECL